MSERWQHKIVDIPVKLFGDNLSERAQAELDKLGPQGWQLVAIAQPESMAPLRLFLKRAA